MLENLKVKMLIAIGKQPKDTDELVDICKISVPVRYLKTNPRQEKMFKYTQRFIKLGRLDVPISVRKVDGKYFLIDEYIRYLIADENGLEKVPVRYVN
jgi:ParB-like chromosome segregation protein Spo0J